MQYYSEQLFDDKFTTPLPIQRQVFALFKKKFRMQWRTQGGGRSTVAPSSTFKSFRRSHVDCSAMTVDYAIPGTPIVLSDGSISLCTLFHLESTEHTILQQTTFIGNSLSTPRLEKILPTYILITVCQIWTIWIKKNRTLVQCPFNKATSKMPTSAKICAYTTYFCFSKGSV